MSVLRPQPVSVCTAKATEVTSKWHQWMTSDTALQGWGFEWKTFSFSEQYVQALVDAFSLWSLYVNRTVKETILAQPPKIPRQLALCHINLPLNWTLKARRTQKSRLGIQRNSDKKTTAYQHWHPVFVLDSIHGQYRYGQLTSPPQDAMAGVSNGDLPPPSKGRNSIKLAAFAAKWEWTLSEPAK